MRHKQLQRAQSLNHSNFPDVLAEITESSFTSLSKTGGTRRDPDSWITWNFGLTESTAFTSNRKGNKSLNMVDELRNDGETFDSIFGNYGSPIP